MKGFIETITGRYVGTTFALDTGEVCNVGSELGNDLFFPNDFQLAPLHFVVSNEDNLFSLKGLADKLFLNNQPVKEAQLTHGDFILAGETLFYFSIEGEKTLIDTPLGKLIKALSKIEQLCLLIDENSDTRILPLLRLTKCNYFILKDSLENLEHLTGNPLLVVLPQEFIEIFVRTFWGQGKLIFVELADDLDNAVFNLKQLLAKTQTENWVDMRFYDPRMLRVMLGEAEKQHAQHFFAGVKKYLVETQIPSHYFEFSWNANGLNVESTRLSTVAKKIPTKTEISEFLIKNQQAGTVIENINVCLQNLLVENETDFQKLIEKSLSDFSKYDLQTIIAKTQFVAINYLIDNNLDFTKLFAQNNFSSDEKLNYFVEKINLQRG